MIYSKFYQEMDCNIKVIARVKPLTPEEATEEKCVHVTSGGEISLRLRSSLFASRHFRLNSTLDEDATQADVFANIEPLIQNFLLGYNCTVFMYGQTGSMLKIIVNQADKVIYTFLYRWQDPYNARL